MPQSSQSLHHNQTHKLLLLKPESRAHDPQQEKPPTPDQADQAWWWQLLTFGTMTSSCHVAPRAPFMGLIPHHIPLFSLLSGTRWLSFIHQQTLWSPLLCSLQFIYIFTFGCSGSLLLRTGFL